MKVNTSFRTVIYLITAILVVFSCSDDGDHRDSTLKALGEPDERIPQTYGTFKSEMWIYAQHDINRIYEFQKSATGCGGSGEWYLYRRFEANDPYYGGYELHDPPPIIEHEPIESAVPGKEITITAVITLSKKKKYDKVIKGANLHYRVTGDSLFDYVTMSVESIEDSLYSAVIPAEKVTVQGADYYIEATSDESSWEIWGRLPELKESFYTIVVSDDLTGQVEKAGYVDSTTEEPKQFSLPEPGKLPGRFAPVGP